MRLEHRAFVGEDLRCPPDVPFIGPARRDAQRDLFAAAANEEGQGILQGFRLEAGLRQGVVGTGEVALRLGKEAFDHGAGFIEARQAFGDRIEGNAILLVFVFLPACAEPQHHAAAADVIQRGRHLREYRRVPVGVAADQRAEAKAGHGGGQGAQGGPAFGPGDRGVFSVGHEVIGVPEAVEPCGLCIAGKA